MLRDSIRSFGHLKCLNPFMFDEMDHCIRIRKNVIDREETDRESNYRGHSNPQWIVGLSGPIFMVNFGWGFQVSIIQNHYISTEYIFTCGFLPKLLRGFSCHLKSTVLASVV